MRAQFNDFFKSPLGKICVIVIGVVFIRKVFDTIKLGSKKVGGLFNNAQDANTLQQAYGGALSSSQVNSRVQELHKIAEAISGAIWGWYTIAFGFVGYRITEDEDTVITELNKLRNATEAAMVSDYYRLYNSEHGVSGKGKSLLADFNEYLTTSEKSEVPASIRMGLK